MGTIFASSVIQRASIVLADTANIHWTTDELLAYLNDGQRELCIVKPTACVRNTDVSLVQGTKQAIPLDGVALVDLTRNTGGNAIRPTQRTVMDAQMPDWHSPARASAKVTNFCHSDFDPKTFYVYPPSPGGNSVEMIYAAIPPDVALNSAIAIDDNYVSLLVSYILFRAFAKDTEYAANAATSQTHYQAFLAPLVGKAPA